MGLVDNNLFYIAALEDAKERIRELRVATAKQQSNALRRGIPSQLEVWTGRLKELDRVDRVLDRMIADKSTTALFEE